MNSWFILLDKKNNGYQMPLCSSKEISEYITAKVDNVFVMYEQRDRFCYDQIFVVDDSSMVIQDGLILNIDELLKKSDFNTLYEYINDVNDQEYFAKFMGPFSGARYFQSDSKLLIFTNQTGDAPVFYSYTNDLFVTSNDFNLIHCFFELNNIEMIPDEDALMSLMTYGYMIDDKTVVKAIKRIEPGQYIIADMCHTDIFTYHRFQFEDKSIDEEEALEKLESLFSTAVDRCFKKDLKYNTPYHLVDISGGMDSRMTNWIAHEIGYNNIVNINFCQSGSKEFKYASGVSYTLHNQYLHKQLDDAGFLYDIDEIVNFNYGLAIFCGITGGKQLLEMLNPLMFGVEHTGQLGDVIVGTYGGTDFHVPIQKGSFKYSSLIDFSLPNEVLTSYKNNEEFGFYCRGFHGILSTSITRRHYFYVVSPFLDPEFMQFCFNIPMQYRNKQRLYWKWVDKYHSDAAKVKSTRERPGNKVQIFMKKGFRRMERTGIKLLGKLHITSATHSKNNMNPFEYWWETDKELRLFFNDYYRENMFRVEDFPIIQQSVNRLFSSKRVIDKMLAVNVLAIYKRYF